MPTQSSARPTFRYSRLRAGALLGARHGPLHTEDVIASARDPAAIGMLSSWADSALSDIEGELVGGLLDGPGFTSVHPEPCEKNGPFGGIDPSADISCETFTDRSCPL